LALLLALLLAACGEVAKAPERLVLTAVPIETVPGWREDAQAEALPALNRSCARIGRLDDAAALDPDGLAGRAADWRGPCAALAAIAPGDHAAARAAMSAHFAAFRAGDGSGESGLFTGYYEPEIAVAPRREAARPSPLLARPADLVSLDLGRFRPAWRGERTGGRVEGTALVPYWTRGEIEGGALAGRGLELAWADPVDSFFLQIQGSGVAVFPDGTRRRLGYGGGNGHLYYPIGRALIERGALTRDAVSLQTIRAWLRANPGEAAAVMDLNPSYVFFRWIEGEGPLGTEGVALTPGRSLAVDRRYVPMGLPLWLDAEDPRAPGARLRRLMVAQDTGGAIRGPVRGDVFWGTGAAAEAPAGLMRSTGGYVLLVPRAVAARRG